MENIFKRLEIFGIDPCQVANDINEFIEASRAANDIAKPWDIVHWAQTETQLTILEGFAIRLKWEDDSRLDLSRFQLETICTQLKELHEISLSDKILKVIDMVND